MHFPVLVSPDLVCSKNIFRFWICSQIEWHIPSYSFRFPSFYFFTMTQSVDGLINNWPKRRTRRHIASGTQSCLSSETAVFSPYWRRRRTLLFWLARSKCTKRPWPSCGCCLCCNGCRWNRLEVVGPWTRSLPWPLWQNGPSADWEGQCRLQVRWYNDPSPDIESELYVSLHEFCCCGRQNHAGYSQVMWL